MIDARVSAALVAIATATPKCYACDDAASGAADLRLTGGRIEPACATHAEADIVCAETITTEQLEGLRDLADHGASAGDPALTAHAVDRALGGTTYPEELDVAAIQRRILFARGICAAEWNRRIAMAKGRAS